MSSAACKCGVWGSGICTSRLRQMLEVKWPKRNADRRKQNWKQVEKHLRPVQVGLTFLQRRDDDNNSGTSKIQMVMKVNRPGSVLGFHHLTRQQHSFATTLPTTY